ncbi:MAG: D-tyrosyl-tRNA(Tyr) deacylase [Lachnospiraceae bacterium]|nr:D-tyrosyl-tRNA(Tyr) deacylase [Lachnospiraceae bacterium]
MKAVVQRVTNASVTVDGEVISEIGKGYLVLLGVGKEDDEQTCERIVKKLIGLRIFEDSEGKTNLSLGQVDGSLLIVSQFTLYADCRKGNRPSFIEAGPPEMAERLYEYFISLCEKEVKNVGRGKFGADMKVALTNDGPFTVILE